MLGRSTPRTRSGLSSVRSTYTAAPASTSPSVRGRHLPADSPSAASENSSKNGGSTTSVQRRPSLLWPVLPRVHETLLLMAFDSLIPSTFTPAVAEIPLNCLSRLLYVPLLYCPLQCNIPNSQSIRRLYPINRPLNLALIYHDAPLNACSILEPLTIRLEPLRLSQKYSNRSPEVRNRIDFSATLTPMKRSAATSSCLSATSLRVGMLTVSRTEPSGTLSSMLSASPMA